MGGQGKGSNLPGKLTQPCQVSGTSTLVLSLITGMVSPQYHSTFDDLFETMSGKGVKNIPISRWQEKEFLVEASTSHETPFIQPVPSMQGNTVLSEPATISTNHHERMQDDEALTMTTMASQHQVPEAQDAPAPSTPSP
jgi:hypothetical protein